MPRHGVKMGRGDNKKQSRIYSKWRKNKNEEYTKKIKWNEMKRERASAKTNWAIRRNGTMNEMHEHLSPLNHSDL